jgi:YbbR domain-containing protein
LENIKQIKKRKPNKLSAFFICLVIACILWLLHSLNTVYVKDIKIPVIYHHLPSGKMLQANHLDSLQLKVKASGLKLLMISMNKRPEPFEINVGELKSNTSQTRYYLSSSLKKLSSAFRVEVEIKAVYPDTIVLTAKNAIQKIVAIKPVFVIDLKPGYTIGNVSLSPDKVLIYGSSSDLKNVDTVYTEAFFESDADAELKKKLNLMIPAGIQAEETKTEVSIEIEKLIERRIQVPIKADKETTSQKIVFFSIARYIKTYSFVKRRKEFGYNYDTNTGSYRKYSK